MTIYVRQFTTTFEVREVAEERDGRTVYGRIVPYGEVATFVDQYDGNKVKRERFMVMDSSSVPCRPNSLTA